MQSECWNGVKAIIETVFGNNDAINLDDAGIQIKVRHFHALQSKKNTPVSFHFISFQFICY